MFTRTFTLLLAFSLALCAGSASGQEDQKIRKRAADAVRTGDLNTAFMSLHALVSSCPGSPFVEESLFALGEYYYGIKALREASRSFFRLLKEYPGSEAAVFCYAYLLDIARRQGQEAQVKALEHALANSRRLVLIFTDSKEFVYASVFGKSYKAVYFIDKVDIYADGSLLTSVDY